MEKLPIIDYPWGDFFEDYTRLWEFFDESAESLSRKVSTENPAQAFARARVLKRIYRYLTHHREALIAAGLLTTETPNARLENRVLESLRYFLVMNREEEWIHLPSPEDIKKSL